MSFVKIRSRVSEHGSVLLCNVTLTEIQDAQKLGRSIPAKEESFTIKVLIRDEPDAWVAHCLELNLVAEAGTAEEVEADIIDIITAHVGYALENDNLAHMVTVHQEKGRCEP